MIDKIHQSFVCIFGNDIAIIYIIHWFVILFVIVYFAIRRDSQKLDEIRAYWWISIAILLPLIVQIVFWTGEDIIILSHIIDHNVDFIRYFVKQIALIPFALLYSSLRYYPTVLVVAVALGFALSSRHDTRKSWWPWVVLAAWVFNLWYIADAGLYDWGTGYRCEDE